MKTKERTLERPKFTRKAKGRIGSVTMDAPAYITLLVRANLTDPSLWPPGAEHGAAALQRIRAIERRCIAKLGHFDWEALSPKLQDEYDGLCADLDRLQDVGDPIPFSQILAEEGKAAR